MPSAPRHASPSPANRSWRSRWTSPSPAGTWRPSSLDASAPVGATHRPEQAISLPRASPCPDVRRAPLQPWPPLVHWGGRCAPHRVFRRSDANPFLQARGGMMTSKSDVVVTTPADVQMVDETGWVWTFLHEASEPDRVYPGALIVAGDPVEPFLARVVDIVDGPAGKSVVHLEVLGVPETIVDELRHARLLPS